jgi:hypothetical protein
MGRRPVNWFKGAMTPAERQARRRERLRRTAEVGELVDHVRRVFKQATATERDWLLDQLVPLIEEYQEDRKAIQAFWDRSTAGS